MSPYRKDHHALNRSREGIVYRFVDAIVEIGLEELLANDTDSTAMAFEELKRASDQLYHEEKQSDWRNTHRHISFDQVSSQQLPTYPSAEEEYFANLEQAEEQMTRQTMVTLANEALRGLSRSQRRRFLLHTVQKVTVRRIAELEGVSHVAVLNSLRKARLKISRFLGEREKSSP